MSHNKTEEEKIFDKIRQNILSLDPVAWVEQNVFLDGKIFSVTNNGYKPLADIFRLIGIKCLEKTSKPVVIVKGRQVGFSTLACAIELFCVGSGNFGKFGRPPIRIAHIFPQQIHSNSYSKTKLSQMISSSALVDYEPKNGRKTGEKKPYIETLLDKDSPSNNSLTYKQFVGGNSILIDSAGLNGDRQRGKSLDFLVVDECQDVPGGAIGAITKTLAKAQYGKVGEGVQLYFGTPKLKGSPFWEMWNQSSQNYYHLKCRNCHDYFPLYTPGSNDWESVWLYKFQVRCTHCGEEMPKLQATEDGKWVETRKADDCKFIGFHINQLFMPEFSKEKIISEKPENHPTNTERLYQNEVLGEFYKGDATLITSDQIREKCGDFERTFRKGIPAGSEKMVVMGVDIGDRSGLEQFSDNADRIKGQGQSYSVITIMSVKGPNLLDIEFAYMLPKNDPESKKTYIEEFIRRYNPDLVISDIGHASDLVYQLQTQFGDRFLASRASGFMTNKIKYESDIFPKEIRFDKNFFIAEIFEQFRKGHIRFPLGSYENIAWVIDQCCSMEVKVSYKYGEPQAQYVKGNKSNDALMSLLNCYLAYKFLITDGFKIKNPFAYGDGLERKPMVIGGYAPVLR